MLRQRRRELAAAEQLKTLQAKPAINKRSRQLAKQKTTPVTPGFRVEVSTLPVAQEANLRLIQPYTLRSPAFPRQSSGVDLARAQEYQRMLDSRKALAS